MKKKLFRIILILCLLLGLALTASAAEPLAEGKYVENITWTIYDNGCLVFKGTGATQENEWWCVPDYLCTIYPIESVVIEEGITELGAYMFIDNLDAESIRSLTLPASLQKVGEDCFIGLKNLERVYISDLEKWNQVQFVSWSNPLDKGAALYLNGVPVEHLVIPESITAINESAFKGCTSLKSVVLHKGITSIGGYSFNTCPNLEKMIFLGDYPAFGDYALTQSSPTILYCADNPTWPTAHSGLLFPNVQWVACDPEVLFTDVPSGAWFEPAVDWAVSKEITKGMGNHSFAPDASCTRGQVVTFLWRAAGCPEPTSTENPFTDVTENDYFYKAVLWAVEEGITNGMSATSFAPGQSCTRAQVATFLWRAAGEEAPTSDTHSFTDIQKDYYYDAVLWAVEWGITNGTSETTFSPDQTCNRAQIVTFLYRFLPET